MAHSTMEGARQRTTAAAQAAKPAPPQTNHLSGSKMGSEHPAGPVKHGPFVQAIRILLFAVYFVGSCLFIHAAQLVGAPLYFVNKDYFYAFMALTKQHFGLLITTMTQWWSPTVVRISGDASVAGQLKQLEDGRVETNFPQRIVLLANHQIYTDWLYLWWTSYTQGLHGHIFIILKQSLKWVPIIGPAMQLYGFIFMARKWASDQIRLRYRLQKLNTRHSGPMTGTTGPGQLDPMWLLIFPEGTNLSANTRRGSAKWAEKTGTQDVKHCLLPRSTGLQFCLQELKGTVEWVYDCTIAYEGIPHGQYGQDIFTLRSVYFQGRPPKSVNMHWRRFKVADIPFNDHEAMEHWTVDRWREKDDMLDAFLRTGRFPGDPVAIVSARGHAKSEHIETEVRPRYVFEFLQIFVPGLAVVVVGRVLVQLAHAVL